MPNQAVLEQKRRDPRIPEFDPTKGAKIRLMMGLGGEDSRMGGNFSLKKPKVCIVVVRSDYDEIKTFPRGGRSMVYYPGINSGGRWVTVYNHQLCELEEVHKGKFKGTWGMVMEMVAKGQIPSPELFPSALL